MELNVQQTRAVESLHPLILCIAGAGTGKTRVLVSRVRRLLGEGVNPDRILCVTFTRAAAQKMGDRIIEGDDVIRFRPEIRTVHSWCARLLRRFPAKIGRTRTFSIYTGEDREDLLRACAEDLGANVKPWSCRLSTLEKHAGVLQEYQARLVQGNAVDYDDLERLALELLQGDEEVQTHVLGKYDHILVDEYQDTNAAQALIFARLNPLNLFIVGDPRQSIYRFRGAEVERIIEAAESERFEVIELTRNYRSGRDVVAVANSIMAAPFAPMEAQRNDSPCCVETLHTENQDMTIARGVVDAIDAGSCPGDVAVLARQWKHLDGVRHELERLQVPVRYCGAAADPWATLDGRMLARALVFWLNPRDLNLARWLDAWGNPGPRCGDHRRVRLEVFRARSSVLDVMAERAVAWQIVREQRREMHPAGEFRKICARILDVFHVDGWPDDARAALEAIPDTVRTLGSFCEWWTFRGLQDRVLDDSDPAVTLSTVHGAKGLEWPIVFLTSCVDGVYPTDRKSADEGDREEDRRVFYVAATRARDALSCVFPVTLPTWGGRTRRARPTPFLEGWLGLQGGELPQLSQGGEVVQLPRQPGDAEGVSNGAQGTARG